MTNLGLSGRTALITGTNNPFGIGAAIAEAIARVGANVFLHYYRQQSSEDTHSATSPGLPFYQRQQSKNPDNLVARLQRFGIAVGTHEADLSDTRVASSLFDLAEKACGPVEVLVNNAAAWAADTFIPTQAEAIPKLWPGQAHTLTAESFDQHFFANTRGCALLMAEFARRHIQRRSRRGRIINISTDAAECFPSEVSYGAAKLALEGYTRSGAAELGQFGITVNALALGPVQTGWISAELEQSLIPTIPLRRIGQPSDVADVVVFLASHQARWVTGQRIFVGGGHRM